MQNSDLQDLIEKYKKELIKYAEENGGFVAEEKEDEFFSESVPVVATIGSQDKTDKEADITELEGTNPDSYDAGRTEPTDRNVAEFQNRNRGEGNLKVQVFSGRQAFPIVNAQVVVTKEFDDGPYTFFDDLTDTSGIVEGMSLNTPLSSEATENNKFLPYSTYSIRVTHPYFIPTVYTNVPVFDGITSIQPVNLVPKTGTPTDDNDIVYTEQEPIDL